MILTPTSAKTVQTTPTSKPSSKKKKKKKRNASLAPAKKHRKSGWWQWRNITSALINNNTVQSHAQHGVGTRMLTLAESMWHHCVCAKHRDRCVDEANSFLQGWRSRRSLRWRGWVHWIRCGSLTWGAEVWHAQVHFYVTVVYAEGNSIWQKRKGGGLR